VAFPFGRTGEKENNNSTQGTYYGEEEMGGGWDKKISPTLMKDLKRSRERYKVGAVMGLKQSCRGYCTTLGKRKKVSFS